ncbi:MAG TPA: hypothetical protein VM095_16295 [Pyrinomonadaceae bacterium]|nr:hypothetical protein [Pyrinomonadaceae bacterium]
MKKCFFSLALILLFLPTISRADVSLFMLESVGVAGEFTGSGHTAIYFSNICAEGPTHLRLCRPGEQGAVISNYPDFGKNSANEWLAIPVISYLYGVENERNIPLYANGKLRNFLRESYRKKYLTTIVPDKADGTMPEGGWRTMLTMAFNRDIYSFNVKTTIEEDTQFLKEFNSSTGKGEFNSFTRNCADFARKVINRYFPGAAHRDVINDFGITTPKAIAKSLTSYASGRPERLFNIAKYSQIAGPIWRSYDNTSFTEKALTSKKYLIPALVFYPPLYGVFAGAYLVTGRFNVHRIYKEYATPQIAQLNLDSQRGKVANVENHSNKITVKEIVQRKKAERSRLFGDRQLWEGYKANFAPVLKSALDQGLFQDQNEVMTFFRDLEIQSEPSFDADGSLILKVRYYGQERTLGITRNNILSANSDRELAYKLMLAKIYTDLNAPEKNRNSLVDFRDDWELMRRLSSSTGTPSKDFPAVVKKRGRFLETPIKPSVERELFKTFLSVTR